MLALIHALCRCDLVKTFRIAQYSYCCAWIVRWYSKDWQHVNAFMDRQINYHTHHIIRPELLGSVATGDCESSFDTSEYCCSGTDLRMLDDRIIIHEMQASVNCNMRGDTCLVASYTTHAYSLPSIVSRRFAITFVPGLCSTWMMQKPPIL